MKMKGNEKLLKILNQRLADEFTAINQYMIHSEMCNNWGYGKLQKAIEKRAMDEMHHAKWLIQRIIFLEGTPVISKLNPMKIGKTVLEMVNNDQDEEILGLLAYNAAIKTAHEVGDEGSVELLTKILKMEQGHIDWAETERPQIEQMGIENYLVNQTEGVAIDE
jgi:bacterioferritin